jgi:hypothetical protein
MGQGGVRTLQSMFAANVPTPQLISLAETAFGEILGPLYAAARYERLPLFSHYQFSVDRGPGVRAAVAALVPDAMRATLDFPGGLELPNVCGFYDEFLARTPLPTQDYHYVSFVHGDLNAANILVDAHDNVWVMTSSMPGEHTSSRIWRSSRTTSSTCSLPSTTTPSCERRSRSPSPSATSRTCAPPLATSPTA